jgi:hypothetical protein
MVEVVISCSAPAPLDYEFVMKESVESTQITSVSDLCLGGLSFLNGFITDFAVQLDDSPLDVGSQQ